MCTCQFKVFVAIEELERRKEEDIAKQVRKQVEVIFTSCRKGHGLDVLNEAIMTNLDAAKRERWLRGAKAHSLKFLEQKREAAEKYVTIAAGASAANGLNPIPGAAFAVDLSVLMKLWIGGRAKVSGDDHWVFRSCGP
jgi:hypothetical protein